MDLWFLAPVLSVLSWLFWVIVMLFYLFVILSAIFLAAASVGIVIAIAVEAYERTRARFASDR